MNQAKLLHPSNEQQLKFNNFSSCFQPSLGALPALAQQQTPQQQQQQQQHMTSFAQPSSIASVLYASNETQASSPLLWSLSPVTTGLTLPHAPQTWQGGLLDSLPRTPSMVTPAANTQFSEMSVPAPPTAASEGPFFAATDLNHHLQNAPYCYISQSPQAPAPQQPQQQPQPPPPQPIPISAQPLHVPMYPPPMTPAGLDVSATISNSRCRKTPFSL